MTMFVVELVALLMLRIYIAVIKLLQFKFVRVSTGYVARVVATSNRRY